MQTIKISPMQLFLLFTGILLFGNCSFAASDETISVTNPEHLIFIDKSLPDIEVLTANVELANSIVVMINPEEHEGIREITDEIYKYNNLKSIHIDKGKGSGNPRICNKNF